MGFFTRTAPTPVTTDGPMTLDEVKVAFGLDPNVYLTDDEVLRKVWLASATLPWEGRPYYTGTLRIAKGSDVRCAVNGHDVGSLHESCLPAIVPIFKKSSGQSIRCIISQGGSNWLVYVRL
jgi:hypothetical protein